MRKRCFSLQTQRINQVLFFLLRKKGYLKKIPKAKKNNYLPKNTRNKQGIYEGIINCDDIERLIKNKMCFLVFDVEKKKYNLEDF